MHEECKWTFLLFCLGGLVLLGGFVYSMDVFYSMGGRALDGPRGYARPAFVVSFLHLPSIGEGAVALFEGGHLLALCKS